MRGDKPYWQSSGRIAHGEHKVEPSSERNLSVVEQGLRSHADLETAPGTAQSPAFDHQNKIRNAPAPGAPHIFSESRSGDMLDDRLVCRKLPAQRIKIGGHFHDRRSGTMLEFGKNRNRVPKCGGAPLAAAIEKREVSQVARQMLFANPIVAI